MADSFLILKFGITRIFLISIGKDYCLVDTSYPSEYRKFVSALKKHKISPAQIKYVFLTHHHTNHTGFLNEIMNESGAKLIAHKDAVPWLKLGINNPAMKPTNKVVSFFMQLNKFGGPPKKNLPFNVTINDF